VKTDSNIQVNKNVLLKNNLKVIIEGGNPFTNGPKLHLYKRNRRLQTSSATRTGSV